MIRTKRLTHVSLLLCALGAGACGSTDDPGARRDHLTTSSDEIIGGTPVSTDAIGTVEISSPQTSYCSGTMLTPTWLLTAHHCVTIGALRTGGTAVNPTILQAHLKGGPNFPNAVQIVRHPTLDVALVRLSQPPTDATGKVFTNRLYRGSSAGLVAQTLSTQAWGSNAITQCTPPSSGSGQQVLRSANLQIAELTGSEYKVIPTAGQINWLGDSGSSLYRTVGGLQRPTGVTSWCNCTQTPSLAVTDCRHVGADFFRDWANGVIGNAPSLSSIPGYDRSDGVNAVVYTDTAGHWWLVARRESQSGHEPRRHTARSDQAAQDGGSGGGECPDPRFTSVDARDVSPSARPCARGHSRQAHRETTRDASSLAPAFRTPAPARNAIVRRTACDGCNGSSWETLPSRVRER